MFRSYLAELLKSLGGSRGRSPSSMDLLDTDSDADTDTDSDADFFEH